MSLLLARIVYLIFNVYMIGLFVFVMTSWIPSPVFLQVRTWLREVV